ncbi:MULTISPECIES: TetR/AcrR family transcriptional regulator [Clostridium]|uniref:TetR/AcrR family transcriptional regulator n=1 Tax=Clostridium TaxID=1485 RepID=UPI00069E92A2|nr:MULTISPECIES: TetR/AcrR family transcriptional regulator [Clostridium]KOF57113.1 TetR family transcriptional regulator [Clostridium sp. DMHC 10]MCD2349044.1 TetR/AcrR family transcriptional regulator [Clostridium guangxiense]
MKGKILDVAAEKIQLYGLKKFTVDEIAAELKISKKTIYKYFKSKDDIILEYFKTIISSDRESVEETLNGDSDFLEKIHKIIYSNHKYKLPIKLMNEARLFYPSEWNQVNELKEFKLESMKELLDTASAEGKIRSDINFSVLCKMLERISDIFVDYDFLIASKLKTTEAIDEAFKIILNGILNK